jgi:hypothetical protein
LSKVLSRLIANARGAQELLLRRILEQLMGNNGLSCRLP